MKDKFAQYTLITITCLALLGMFIAMWRFNRISKMMVMDGGKVSRSYWPDTLYKMDTNNYYIQAPCISDTMILLPIIKPSKTFIWRKIGDVIVKPGYGIYKQIITARWDTFYVAPRPDSTLWEMIYDRKRFALGRDNKSFLYWKIDTTWKLISN